jgi:hypothetical protein
MKLEYLDDITDNGKYPWADPAQLIRLYDFDKEEAKQFVDIFHAHIVIDQAPLDLSTVAFITSQNCRLKFELDVVDHGIEIPSPGNAFVCRLTLHSYKAMIGYMEVFAGDETDLKGYHWLYEPEANKIDLLFSPVGHW